MIESLVRFSQACGRLNSTVVRAACLALTVATISYTPLSLAFPSTQCAADRAGIDVSCTSADVSATLIITQEPINCVIGSTINIDISMTITAANPTRYDIGAFVASDGKDVLLQSANGGSGNCAVYAAPNNLAPFSDADADPCGDAGGGSSGTWTLPPSTPVKCVPDGTGHVAIFGLVSAVQPGQNAVCTGPDDIQGPGSAPKCSHFTHSLTTVVQGKITI